MNISFTGHRDKTVLETDLEKILAAFPDSTWVHGGAKGFDSQVNSFAETHGIPTNTIKPDYERHGRAAPLIRNRVIVDSADVLFACWDGRKKGGTFYTVQYARKKNKKVHVLTPQ